MSDSSSEFDKMCQLIGLMTIQWAHAENALALSIAVIDISSEGIAGYKELPVSLKKRLDYLRLALRNVPGMEVLQESGALLIKRFGDLKVIRAELVHGSAVHLGADQFVASVFRSKGRLQTVSQRRFGFKEAYFFNLEVRTLADQACAFLVKVNELFSEKA